MRVGMDLLTLPCNLQATLNIPQEVTKVAGFDMCAAF